MHTKSPRAATIPRHLVEKPIDAINWDEKDRFYHSNKLIEHANPLHIINYLLQYRPAKQPITGLGVFTNELATTSVPLSLIPSVTLRNQVKRKRTLIQQPHLILSSLGTLF